MAAAIATRKPAGRVRFGSARRLALSLLGPVVVLALWELVSVAGLIDPLILPSPVAVAAGLVSLMQDGTLEQDAAISLWRILVGWIVGSAVAIPIGLAVGAYPTVRQIADPFIHFFRFVPSIALITLFILWFGVGEQSKVALIVYAAGFIVLVNTATGVVAIPSDKLDAARCLGASRRQLFFSVIAPASVPYIFVGMRLALASAFLVIVGAEIIAANSGLGYLTWVARLYFKVDWVFAGVFTIGVAGFVCDGLWLLVGRTVLARYLGQIANY